MRYKSVIGAIPGFHEKCQANYQPKHDTLIVRIQHTNDNQENPSDNTQKMHPGFFAPYFWAMIDTVVDDIRDESAQGPKDNIEQPEHGSPSSRSGLSKSREVFEVIGTQDGIDG